MSHPRIAARLYTEAWCILPDVHSSLCSQFLAHTKNPSAFFTDGGGESEESDIQIAGPVALVKVEGVIGKHLSEMETECGGYDLATLEKHMATLAADPLIRAVVIYFNTPGGVAIGVESAAKSIRACAEAGKKVIGYTDYQCCSAGYWLASACDEFHAEGSAVIGSISTFMAGIDSHRMWEMMGLELKLFRTGELKAIGMEGKIWTPEEEAFLQEKTDSIDSDFKSFVGARRGLTAEQMNGAYWYAKHAPAGLADSTTFSNLSALLEAVYSSI